MKKGGIRQVLDGLKKINLAEIENEELKNVLIDNHIKILSENRKLAEKIEDVRTAMLSGFGEEQKEFAMLQDKLSREQDPVKMAAIRDEIDSHVKYKAALNELTKAIEAILKEDIEVKPIDAILFAEEYRKQGYNMAVVEAIYPLFE